MTDVLRPRRNPHLVNRRDLTARMWDTATATQTNERRFGFDLASIAITPDGRTAVFSAKTTIYLGISSDSRRSIN